MVEPELDLALDQCAIGDAPDRGDATGDLGGVALSRKA